jgi:hypothetical protein
MPGYLPAVFATARDSTLRYLKDSRHADELARREARQGRQIAMVQAVREACPELSRTWEDDVADMVRAALRARAPRVAARVRGERGWAA